MTVNENRDTSYLERKRIFLEENGFYDIEKPALEAEYDPLYIESNLANLRQLLIEVTDKCNLACKYCGYGELYGNYDKRTGRKQNFKNVRLLINFLADLWHSPKNISFDNVVYIGFYGGEPLMNFSLIKQVVEYMDTIKIPGLSFEYNMTTNAMLLSRYMDYIVDKKFHLLISLDGSKENNGYRVTKSGKESFDRIYSNIKKLKENYHEYFDTYVEFNAVLHNRNSFVSAYKYIKETFNKTPRIAELNSNGIIEDRKKDFYNMFTSKTESYKQLLNCEEYITDDELYIDPQIIRLNNFIEIYSGNTYKTMPDLFFSKENQAYLPTNTCPPFYKKIFLTVNGKIFPCERIGQNFPLGYIDQCGVKLDIKSINTLYTKLYGNILDKCKKCLMWKNCGICIFHLPKGKSGNVKCPYFYGSKEMNDYFSEHLTKLEQKPELYEEITKKIIID
jgi:uncharacterized protein